MARPATGQTKTRHIRIPDDLWDRAETVAAAQNRSRAEIVNELLRWYLDEYGRPSSPDLPVPPRPE